MQAASALFGLCATRAAVLRVSAILPVDPDSQGVSAFSSLLHQLRVLRITCHDQSSNVPDTTNHAQVCELQPVQV